MRKIQIIGLALVAMFAFGAIAASSALAAEEWVVDNVAAAGPVAVQTTGTVLLTDLNVPALKEAVTVTCQGILDGTVTTAGKDEITEVLNSAGTEKIGELGGKALLCNNEAKQCEHSTEVEVFVEKLNWTSQLTLSGTEWIDTTSTPAYEVICLILLIPNVDLCEGVVAAKLENDAGEMDVLASINAQNAATCTQSGGLTGDIEAAEGLIATTAGLSLAMN
jgi:hypothetical protein